MSLKPEEFMDISRGLAVGRTARAEHWCGSGSPMVVGRDANGIWAWCHRCHEAGFARVSVPLKERLAMLHEARKADAEAECHVQLPKPMVYDHSEWPVAARLYLYRCGISEGISRWHGLYYNPKMQRVIIPVLDRQARPVYWQGRGFNPDLPKALNPKVDKPVAEYSVDKPIICVTEDLLSGIKVARHGHAVVLLGTATSEETLALLLREKKPVAIMLDSDTAGRRGARKLARSLTLLGIKNKQVYFGKDPKLVSSREIENSLEKFYEAQ